MTITELRQIGSTRLNTTSLGLGSASLGNRFRRLDESTCHELVDDAWEGGIRLFDTAPMYGHGLAENRIGTALRRRPRDEYLLATKVGRLLRPGHGAAVDPMWAEIPPMHIEYDYSYAGTMRSVEDSLQRMLIDRIDIAFIHDCDRYGHGDDQPAIFDQAMSGAAAALISLREQGVIGAVGLGVNEADVCVAAAQRADFDLFLLAGRYSLLEQDALDELLPLCARDRIGLVLGGIYNSGILATGDVAGAQYNYGAADQSTRRRVADIDAVCTHHGVPIAAVALQFVLAHPAVTSVLIGSSTPNQLRRNIDGTKTVVPEALWTELKERDLIRQDAPVPHSPSVQ